MNWSCPLMRLLDSAEINAQKFKDLPLNRIQLVEIPRRPEIVAQQFEEKIQCEEYFVDHSHLR
jgi:hypothetical protein